MFQYTVVDFVASTLDLGILSIWVTVSMSINIGWLPIDVCFLNLGCENYETMSMLILISNFEN